ncbi:hypothetical protein J437_LFUL010259 [Ladona fulva]|uniref:C2H2-type domain-containing protein n=1 Tax=Ladona fulva TaxID=123851 RepID=A0A8K0KBA4_LADFU|nr:hypothetical protein J437_LFUL010259 [Ladona fulva]
MGGFRGGGHGSVSAVGWHMARGGTGGSLAPERKAVMFPPSPGQGDGIPWSSQGQKKTFPVGVVCVCVHKGLRRGLVKGVLELIPPPKSLRSRPAGVPPPHPSQPCWPLLALPIPPKCYKDKEDVSTGAEEDDPQRHLGFGKECEVGIKTEAVEEVVNEEEYVGCDHCGEKRNTKKELREHIYNQHLSLFVVDQRDDESEDKVKRCTLCHNEFKSKEYLERHLWSDTREKPFKCCSCRYKALFGWRLILGNTTVKRNSSVMYVGTLLLISRVSRHILGDTLGKNRSSAKCINIYFNEEERRYVMLWSRKKREDIVWATLVAESGGRRREEGLLEHGTSQFVKRTPQERDNSKINGVATKVMETGAIFLSG